LSGNWDAAVEASLESVGRDDLGEQLNKYLSDAHAIESQSHQMLTKAKDIGGHPDLEHDYAHHLEETVGQRKRLEERLEARGAGTNTIKDAAMRLGALNWGAFFAAQPDTPAKLAGFAFAFEHLEIAGYEQLRRVAERAGDTTTAGLAERIIAEERTAADKIAAHFDEAAAAALASQGVA
jgi:ferritin-like metal-binding protein YciE